MTEYEGYKIFGIIVDLLFLVDIMVNFFSAYQMEDGFEQVDDRKTICINYIKGWFLIDIVAIIPFDIFIHSDVN